MSYLETKFKNYRCIAEIDTRKNDFPRDIKGGYSDSDVYIKCQKNIKVFHYGKGILDCYIPSLGQGRNILKAIEADGMSEVIFEMYQTDSEVCFKFKANDMELMEKYLKPSTFGSSIKAHSVKNLPKNKTFSIPNEQLEVYTNLTASIPREKSLALGKLTRGFISSLATKKNPSSSITADMRLKGLKGKEYIYSIGLWDKYIKYLEKEIPKCIL